MPELGLSLFGNFQAVLDGDPLTGRLWAKTRALWAYLATESSQPHLRSFLAGLLWPDQPENAARHSLRQAFHQMRLALGSTFSLYFTLDSQRAQFHLPGNARLDISQFADLIEQCRQHPHRHFETCRSCSERLEVAVALYRGPFLEEFSLKDSSGFEDWALMKRETFARLAAFALQNLTDFSLRHRNFEKAEFFARRQLEIDPYLESAHRHLMQALALSGRRTAALVHYKSLRKMLEADLGLATEPTTHELFSQIAKNALTFPRLPPLLNWPDGGSRFVGRKRELQQIGELLQTSEARLLNLIGPGGIGKTRLAIEAAVQEVHSFEAGACFVPLESITSPESAVLSISGSIGLSFTGAYDPKTQLIGYLKGREILLVLDNLEQFITANSLIADMLQSCPSIKFLTASRERLNLKQEWVLPLEGLPVPKDGQLDGLESFDSVQLFLERARQARLDFALQAHDKPAVRRICQLTGGMPLALELAAAWVKDLTCVEIAQEIEKNIGFLSVSWEDLPPRQRSLRAVFEQTWVMLTPEEQRILRSLGVFQGGCYPEAAEQVVGASLSTLSALASRSLLKLLPSGRIEQHPLIHQFAQEKLAEMPDVAEVIQRRHGQYYLEFGRVQGARLKGSQQIEALAEMNLEIENLRSAWGWAVDSFHLEEIEAGLEGLMLFYRARGWNEEGVAAMGRLVQAIQSQPGLLPETNTAPRRMLGAAQVGQGICTMHLGRFSQAYALLQSGLETLGPDGPPWLLAHAYSWLGVVTKFFGDYPRAEIFAQEGLKFSQQTSDQWMVGIAHLCLGHAIRPLNYPKAGEHYRQSAGILRELGDRQWLAVPNSFLGEILIISGRLDEARRLLQEGLSLAQEVLSRQLEGRYLAGLGEIAYEQGDFQQAKDYLQASETICREIGEIEVLAIVVTLLGVICEQAGEHASAQAYFYEVLQKGLKMKALPVVMRCLVRFVEPYIEKSQVEQEQATEIMSFVNHHPSAWHEERERSRRQLNRLETRLAKDLFERAVDRGKSMPVEALVAEIFGLIA